MPAVDREERMGRCGGTGRDARGEEVAVQPQLEEAMPAAARREGRRHLRPGGGCIAGHRPEEDRAALA